MAEGKGHQWFRTLLEQQRAGQSIDLSEEKVPAWAEEILGESGTTPPEPAPAPDPATGSATGV